VAIDVRDPSEERARAIAFLIDAYAGVRTKPGKGLPHAQAVADVLADKDYGGDAQLAALLHDVVEDTARTTDDVDREFGHAVADLVAQLTEDDSVTDYAPRKQALRDQLQAAGSPALEIALADKIATMRHAALTGVRVRRRKLDHYRATLRLGREAQIAAPLCAELEDLLTEATERSTARSESPRR
jgi:(p)ppGpp synthase/HD superfamily hydrolase